jgi:mRNA interferase MazF
MLPEAGDIAWVELDPVKGTEQAGRRPALVVSDLIYHEASRRSVICPITSSGRRPWPLNVPLPAGLETMGFVLVDQVRTIDRAERMFGIVERVPQQVLVEVRGLLAALLGLEVLSSIAPGSS